MMLKSLPIIMMSTIFVQAADVTRVQYLMGTLCEIRVSGTNEEAATKAISAAFDEIARLESLLSTYKEDSEATRLNRYGHDAPQKVSHDTFDLIKKSIFYSEKTNGAFSITLRDAPVIVLNDADRMVSFNERDARIDFGGIGKGYALDKAAVVLKKNGVQRAELNFSGNLLFISDTEAPFTVQVSDPLNPATILNTLSVSRGSVSTSSQHMKPGHIVDPKTRQPVNFNGSVTVISPTATEADALSTALIVLGSEKGLALIAQKFKQSDAVFYVESKDGWAMKASSNFQKKYAGGSNREQTQ